MPRPSPPVGAPAPPSRRNIGVGSHAQLTVTAAPASRVKATVSKAAWWAWSFDRESDVWVTCDVGYLCADFDLPRPRSILDLGPMYATDRRQTKASLNAPSIRGGV